MADLTTRGIEAYKQGDIAGAYRLLLQAVQTNPNDELAWLWLSGTVASTEDKIRCLEYALRINPANQVTHQALARLRQNTALPTGDGESPATAVAEPELLETAAPTAPLQASYSLLTSPVAGIVEPPVESGNIAGSAATTDPEQDAGPEPAAADTMDLAERFDAAMQGEAVSAPEPAARLPQDTPPPAALSAEPANQHEAAVTPQAGIQPEPAVLAPSGPAADEPSAQPATSSGVPQQGGAMVVSEPVPAEPAPEPQAASQEPQPFPASMPACPSCGQSDNVFSVRRIVTEGLPDHVFGSAEDTLSGPHLTPRLLHTLQERLAPPPKPDPDMVKNDKSFLGPLILIDGAIFAFLAGAYFLLNPFHLTIGNFDNVTLAIISLIIIAAVFLVLYYAVIQTRLRSRRQKYIALEAEWQHQISNWNQLYYCLNDDALFIPGQTRTTPINQIKRLLKL